MIESEVEQTVELRETLTVEVTYQVMYCSRGFDCGK